MSAIRWLHLSDLHQGLPEQTFMWPFLEKALLEDLESLIERSGPPDLVLFTGDLTQSGTETQFQRLNDSLEKLWRHFERLGASPLLLAVPGNHDLVRPKRTHAVVKALNGWEADPEILDEVTSGSDNEYRSLLYQAFEPFSRWSNQWRAAHPAPDHLEYTWAVSALLPGDFAVKLKKEGQILGVVGLNSSFLQLTGDDHKSRLWLFPQQLTTLLPNPPEWAQTCHASVLMTHHPIDWLHSKSLTSYHASINPPGQFTLHLYGHMHESHAATVQEGGDKPRRWRQSPSLFGLEKWGDGSHQVERRHGYGLFEFSAKGMDGEIKTWPREARKRHAGNWALVPDQGYTLLGDSYCEQIKLTHALVPQKPTKSGANHSDLLASKPTRILPSAKELGQGQFLTEAEQHNPRQSESTPQPALDRYLESRHRVKECIEGLRKAARAIPAASLADACRQDGDIVERGPTIAIVGSFSSGKTTFVNALFGRELLPVSNFPTTAAVTQIRSGRSHQVSIRLKSPELLGAEKKEAERKLREWQSAHESGLDPSRLKRKDLVRVAELEVDYARKNSLPLTGYRLDVIEEHGQFWRFLSTQEESLAHYVERVEITYPFDHAVLPEGVSLFDTPGANSPFPFHIQATYRALQQSDAVLFFFVADSPFSDADLELLSDIARIRRNQKESRGALHDRFIFVVNGIDKLNLEGDVRSSTLVRIKRKLQEFGIDQPCLIGLSALLALAGRLRCGNREVDRSSTHLLQKECEGDAERSWKISGMAATMNEVWNLLGGSVGQGVLLTGVERAQTRLPFLKAMIEEQEQAVRQGVGIAEERAKRARKEMEQKRKSLDQLLGSLGEQFEKQLAPCKEVATLTNKLEALCDRVERDLAVNEVVFGRAVKVWSEERHLLIEAYSKRCANLAIREITPVLESLDRERRQSLELPHIQFDPLKFDNYFDLEMPRTTDPEATMTRGTIAGAGVGLIMAAAWGTFWGGILLTLAGAMVGLGVASDHHTTVTQKVRKGWAAALRKRLDSRVMEVETALAQQLGKLSQQLQQWVRGYVDGYLSDLSAQLDQYECLAREAQVNRKNVDARLSAHRDRIESCEAQLEHCRLNVLKLIEASRTHPK